jgi:DNA-binding transcriptional MerR regulator
MAHRQRLVAQLRVQGYSIRDITHALEERKEVNPATGQPWGQATVARDVTLLLADWKRDAARDTASHQAQHLADLRAVRKAAWGAGEWGAILRALKQESELLGLNAPQKVAPTTPAGDKPWQPDTTGATDAFLHEVATLLAQFGGAGTDEALPGSPAQSLSALLPDAETGRVSPPPAS